MALFHSFIWLSSIPLYVCTISLFLQHLYFFFNTKNFFVFGYSRLYHILLIRCSLSGHSGCFHALAIMNSAAVITGVHVSFQIGVLSGCMPSSGIARFNGSSFQFLKINYVLGCARFLQLWEWGLPSGCGVVASLVVEHGLQSLNSVLVVLGLRCPLACGILPDQGSNQCPLHWCVDSQPLDRQESSFFKELSHCSPQWLHQCAFLETAQEGSHTLTIICYL